MPIKINYINTELINVKKLNPFQAVCQTAEERK